MKQMRTFEDHDEVLEISEIPEPKPEPQNKPKKEPSINLLPVVGIILIALLAAVIYWYKNVYLPKQNKE